MREPQAEVRKWLRGTLVAHKTKYLRLCATKFYLCNRTGVLVAKEAGTPW